MKMNFFSIAKKASKSGEHRQHRISAVVVRNGKPLAVGFNREKFHPNAPHPFRSIHAEYSAMKRTPYGKLDGATVYVYREGRDGMPRNSRPCPHCYAALKAAGVKRICYTVDNAYKEEKIA